MYYAHSENGDGFGCRETLADHLRLVSERAARYASVFDAQQQALTAGLIHDLGKYADQFQRRLDAGSKEKGRNHSAQGAILLAQRYKRFGVMPALAIEGHHGGLRKLTHRPDYVEQLAVAMRGQPNDFTDADVGRLLSRFKSDGLTLPEITGGLVDSDDFAASDMLDVRMLFSTLVDADFIETEAHFDGNVESPRQYRDEGPSLDPARALDAVQREIDELTRKSEADRSVKRMRTALVETCLVAATCNKPGIFTLSAPTGSGKTLAMLAFALRHAMEHDLRRVIVVMPFLSIIDQTAALYRKLFSREDGFLPQFVIEDHSNVRAPGDEAKDAPDDSIDQDVRVDRLLAENWDAPIVLTTTVQCLESLMSNRPSACRKLHRLGPATK